MTDVYLVISIGVKFCCPIIFGLTPGNFSQVQSELAIFQQFFRIFSGMRGNQINKT